MNFGSILDSQESRHQEQGCSCIQGTVSYEVRQKWIMHNRVYNIMHLVYLSTGMFSLSITLFHQGPAKKARACRAGSHYLHYLQYELNDLNAKKSQPSGDLNPSNMQSRHMPWEPHTNRDGIFHQHSTILVVVEGSTKIKFLKFLTFNQLCSYLI